MKLIAHRGIWNDVIQDNSYEALTKALNSSKYVGIECDIRETLDQEFVIYHNVLYQGNLVKNTLYKDIKKDVCKLEDILKIETQKILLLEIKDFKLNKEKLLKLLNKYPRNIYLMSFDKKVIKDLKQIDSKYKYGVLNYILNSESDYNLDFICLLDFIATNEIIKNFLKRNIELIIYGVINPTRNLTYIVDDNKINNR